MKKYLLPALIVFIFITFFWFLPTSLSAPMLSLLALGIIPGTNTEMGIALPLIAGGIALIMLIRWLRQLSGELMEYKTETALREETVAAQTQTPATMPSDLPLNAEEIDLLSI